MSGLNSIWLIQIFIWLTQVPCAMHICIGIRVSFRNAAIFVIFVDLNGSREASTLLIE